MNALNQVSVSNDTSKIKKEESTEEIFGVSTKTPPPIPQNQPYKSEVKIDEVWGNQYKRKKIFKPKHKPA